MRILFISENLPYPLDSGGKIRTYYIMKGLSQKHDITLVTTVKKKKQYRHVPELEKICQEVSVINAPYETTFQLGIKLIKSFFSPAPIVVERHYLSAVADEIKRLVAAIHFDVVHFDHLDASFYLPYIPEALTTVLDEHNIVSNQVETSANAEPNLFKKLYMKFQLEKTVRYESKIGPQMTRCFVCSDTDKAYLLDMAKDARIVTIPNGVDVDYFSNKSRLDPSQHLQESPSVIFVGMLDYGPGGVAVRYFCQEILPLLQQKVPDIRFYAVGQNPPKYLQTLAEQSKNIVLTGRVDDIRPYVARSKVFVVPLKSGSGTRLKILDAMAMGIPVVSTSIGAEGLDVHSGENIFIADTPEAFSFAILQLLQDEKLAMTIKDNALQLVRETYSWKKIWSDLLAAYTELENM